MKGKIIKLVGVVGGDRRRGTPMSSHPLPRSGVSMWGPSLVGSPGGRTCWSPNLSTSRLPPAGLHFPPLSNLQTSPRSPTLREGGCCICPEARDKLNYQVVFCSKQIFFFLIIIFIRVWAKLTRSKLPGSKISNAL